MNDIWLDPPTDPAEFERAIEVLSTNPLAFVRNVFAIMEPAGWIPMGPVEEDIVSFAFDGSHGRVRQVLAFRGVGKSHLITATLGCYRLMRHPGHKIIIRSKNDKESTNNMRTMRVVLASCWFLAHLTPNTGQTDNTHEFDVASAVPGKQHTCIALTIGGMLSGMRAHTIIDDDVEDDNNVVTREARERLYTQWSAAVAWLYSDKDNDGPDPVEHVIIGTYKDEEDSLYTKNAEEGIPTRAWPIRYPKADETVPYLAPMMRERVLNRLALPGEPAVPLRFPFDEISKREVRKTYFRREYMLIAGKGQKQRCPLILSDLMVMPMHRDQTPVPIMWGERDANGSSTAMNMETMDRDGACIRRPAFVGQALVPYTGTKAGIDPAGRGDDRIGLAIVSQASNMFFVKHLDGLEGSSSAGHRGVDGEYVSGVYDIIALRLRDHMCREAHFEVNIDSTGAWESLMQAAIRRHKLEPGQNPLYPEGWSCSLLPVRNTGVKEFRIVDTLEPLVSSRRLVLDPSCVSVKGYPDVHDEFQFQFSRIRRERRCLVEDGMLDALAIALTAWVGSSSVLRIDDKEASDKAIDRRIKEMRQKYTDALQRSRGIRPTQPNWIAWR